MDSSSPAGKRTFLYLAVNIGNLVAFSAGIMLGWTSPVNAKLENIEVTDDNPFGRPITSEESSWISSLLALGAIFGPVLAGYLADKIGRKKTLLLVSGVPLLVSYIMLAFGRHIAVYYVARFVAGFALGGVFTVLPNFISEVSEDSIRGLMSSSMNVYVVSGPFFAYALGPYVPILWFNVTCAVFPALFVVLFFLFVPESPYYLVSVHDSRAATEALVKFRSSTESGVMKEMEMIKRTVDEALSSKGSFLDIFKSRSLVRAIIISMTLAGFQQFSGINAVLFNTETIFKDASTDIPPEIASMIVGAVQIGTSLITPLLVDRLGRKILLLISGFGMLIAEVPLGVYFYLKDDNTDVSAIFWLPILCLIAYIIAYNLGFGPLPWVVMAEVFPANVKAPASTATASFCWVLGFLVTKFFPSLKDAIGMYGSFWLFSGFCLLAIIFVFAYMIETKGKSFQEIQDILAS